MHPNGMQAIRVMCFYTERFPVEYNSAKLKTILITLFSLYLI